VALGWVLVLGPQLLGGATGWSVPAIAALALCCLGGSLLISRRIPGSKPADVALVAAWIWTVVQALPLPVAILESLGRRRQLGAEPVFAVGEWLPLSLDPASTREAIVFGVGVLSTYALARVVAARRRSLVVTLVASSCAMVAIVSIFHELAGAERVFGVYQPREANPPLLGPFLNPNHLSGLLAFGCHLFVALALARTGGRRLAFALGATLCGVTCLVSVSRGGAVSLLVGLIGLACLALVHRRDTDRRVALGRAAVVGGTLATIVGMGAYVGLQGLTDDFQTGDASKLELIARAGALSVQHPIVGLGRGAFGAVFTQHMGTTVRYTHPENLVVQWGVEWGLPFTCWLLFVLGRALLSGLRSRSITVAGASVGLVALFLHDQVDFLTEQLGGAVLAVATLGAVVSERSERRRRADWKAAGAVVAMALTLGLLGWRVSRERPEALIDELTAAASDPSYPSTEALVERAARARPLHAGVALWIGELRRSQNDTRALRWLNRAMALAPGWASAHVLTADTLWRMGAPDQALVELREAERLQPGSATRLVCSYAARRGSAEAVLRAAPEAEASYLSRVQRCIVDPALSLEVDERLRLLDADDADLLVRDARRAVAREDLDAAARLLERALERDADHVAARVELARVRGRAGQLTAAIELLANARDTSGLRQRAQLEERAGELEKMRTTLSTLRAQAAGDRARLSQVWMFTATLERSAGNTGAAMQALEQAHRLQPTELGPLREIAALAEAHSQLARALRAFGDLCELGETSACERRDQLMQPLERRPPSLQRRREPAADD